MRNLLRRSLIYAIAITMLLPTWAVKGLLQPSIAAAAQSSGGSSVPAGTKIGTGTSVLLSPLMITDNSVSGGDIDQTKAIIITLDGVNSSGLEFDVTASVKAVESGTVSVKLLPDVTANTVTIPVYVDSVSGDAVTVSGIKVKAATSGATSDFSGVARLKAEIKGGIYYGDNFTVDAQKPAFNNLVVTPAIAKAGSQVKIRFSASEALQSDPAVQVGANIATKDATESAGLTYVYTYSVPANENSNGAVDITINGTDLNGNVSGEVKASSVLAFDTVAPAKPTNVVATNVSFASKYVTITGTAEAGSLVGVVGGAQNVNQQLLSNEANFSISVPLNENGSNTFAITATDPAGNVSEATSFSVASTPVNQSDTTANIPINPTGSTIVTIPSEVGNAVLDLSALVQPGTSSVVVPNLIVVNATTVQGSAQLIIPAGTTITGPSNWDGMIKAIQVISQNSVSIVLTPGKKVENVTAYEIGISNSTLTASPAIKIVLIGAAGKSVGYLQNGGLKEIKNTCSVLDNPVLESGSECKIGSLNDLVIWTTHLTVFVTYNAVSIPLTAPVATVNKVERNNDRFIKIEWQGIDLGVEKYQILINGMVAETIEVSGTDSGVNYSREIKILNPGRYEVTLQAIRGNDKIVGEVKTVELTAPVVVTSTPQAQVVSRADASQGRIARPVAEQQGQVEEPKKTEEAAPSEESDENGVIKGDEEGEDNEKVNWTPWIILFILILLTGAATGGYFYWFGEEEGATPAKPAEVKETPKETPATKAPAKKSPSKRSKRW